MTTFSNDKAIYLQMADRLCDEILAGLYGDDDRIPSVREYAVLLQVNTNTAVKAYDALARDGIIYNRRALATSCPQAHATPSCRHAAGSLWSRHCPTCSAV